MRPNDRSHLKSNEWCEIEKDIATLGISDHAVSHLSDLVFLDLPHKGTSVTAGESFGEIESVKAVSDLYSPVSSEVLKVNKDLPDHLDWLSGCVRQGVDAQGARHVEVDGPDGRARLRRALCHRRLDGPSRLRRLDDPPGEPCWNMALDEALLLGEEPATLRFYGWSPHAVSLGHFQRHADFADVPASVPIVRRLTGGGAIHHGDELTWSLAVDGRLLPRAVDDTYALLHDGIAKALGAIGVAVRRVRDGAAPTARPTDRWCFSLPGRHDLVTDDGKKLCGSAQRRLCTRAVSAYCTTARSSTRARA